MVIEITAYHGTCLDNIQSIKQNDLKESNKGWFGTGIYFYEDSYNMAFKWAERKSKKPTVLTASIEVEEEKIFDLTDPRSDHAEAFHDLRETKFAQFKGKYKDQLDNIVINAMHKLWEFHVVRGVSHSFAGYDTNRLGSNVPNGIEVVVRNHACIKSLE